MELTAAAVWLNTVFAEFDLTFTRAVHGLYEVAGGFFTPFFSFISILGKAGIFLILLSFVLVYFVKTRRFGAAMLIGVAMGAVFTNLWLKVVIARPRPYLFDEYRQLWQLVGMKTESDFCFPSGHTCAAFAASTAVFWTGKKRVSWTAFIFGILMGISRIYLVVHYPTDVVGGIIIGFLAGSLGALFAAHLPNSFYRKKPKDVNEINDVTAV